MAWNRVKVSVDGESINAMLKHDESELEISNVLEVGDSIKVGKKTFNVLSTTTNNIDNLLNIKLAVASPVKGAKNGESIKGRDKGKS
tara:strand:- start:2627 stop:2887 length:261 start_codon:yes stop_codon:yes gene_type:complete